MHKTFRGCPEQPCWSVLSIKLHAVWHGSSGWLLNVSCKCLFNLCSVCRERFESDSEIEVFVRSCPRNSDNSKEHVCGEVFWWKWRLADVYLLKLNFNVEYFWKFLKLFFLFQLFSGTPLSEFRNRNFLISAWKKVLGML